VIDGLSGPAGNVSTVISAIPARRSGTRPRFVAQPDGTISNLMEFNALGQLVPAGIIGTVSPPRPSGLSCWGPSLDLAVIPLNSVPTGATTLRIGYLSGGPGQVLVTYGGRSQALTITKGLNSGYLPVQGNSGEVIVQPLRGSLPCVGDAQVGVLLPSSTAPAIPHTTVTG
jgi:hypothetical protein